MWVFRSNTWTNISMPLRTWRVGITLNGPRSPPTSSDRVAGFNERGGGIPTAFVAVLGADVVGLACLVECDIESHQHLTPWLASVLVAPEHRGRGIGSALCERATEARLLGVEKLYLFTFNRQRLYGRLGWLALENALYAGASGTIMVRTLAA